MTKDISKIYRTAVSDEELPRTINLTIEGTDYLFHKLSWDIEGESRGLRYGTNPHQSAAIYVPESMKERSLSAVEWKKWGKDGPSATNIEDGYRALRIVSYFKVPAAAVMKHLNPTGVGITQEDKWADAFERAWSGDPRAAYGSTIGFNYEVDGKTADSIVQRYVECIFAPSYSSEALKILEQKKNLRIAAVPDISRIEETSLPYLFKILGNILLLEQRFKTKIRTIDDIERCFCATKREPTEKEKLNMIYSWWVCSEKRSNGVVLWRGEKALAVGTGQQDRIGAIEIALDRARRSNHSLADSALASDGFMLRDNIDPLHEAGVTAIIQPGGSIYDGDVIQKCEDYGISMIFTGERVFRHF